MALAIAVVMAMAVALSLPVVEVAISSLRFKICIKKSLFSYTYMQSRGYSTHSCRAIVLVFELDLLVSLYKYTNHD